MDLDELLILITTDATTMQPGETVYVIIAGLRIRLALRGVVSLTMQIEVWLLAQVNLVLIHVLSRESITPPQV